MASLNTLKQALGQVVVASGSCLKRPLSSSEYSAGFDILKKHSGNRAYKEFITPQLSSLLETVLKSRHQISILEIGPGPESVVGQLPCDIRRSIKRYVAYEPNDVYCSALEQWLHPPFALDDPFPCLDTRSEIHDAPFELGNDTCRKASAMEDEEKFDIILFCHSMYGMNPKQQVVEKALSMINDTLDESIVIIFHRNGTLGLDSLVCHRSASYPQGIVRIATDEETLDHFTSFIAGFVPQHASLERDIRDEWRKVCKTLGGSDKTNPDHACFTFSDLMISFNKHALSLPELRAQAPSLEGRRRIKNPEARLQRPALVVKPTDITQIQMCVRWAIERDLGLTVMGGTHSGHCLRQSVVAIDMSAFNQLHIVPDAQSEVTGRGACSCPMVFVEAGCNTGKIIERTMKAGLTVPLGARPSVGAGLWLQGGIGHLARMYGLACDAIVGAVLVSVDSGRLLHVGSVPRHYLPVSSTRAEHDTDLLWALRGAGTNFGIVVSIVFKAYKAPTYAIQHQRIPLVNNTEARLKLKGFYQYAKSLPRNRSADAYLFFKEGQLCLGVTVFEATTTEASSQPDIGKSAFLKSESDTQIVNGIGIFDTEMYMSEIHGGPGGGKTSTFKRCVFLKQIAAPNMANILISAVQRRPSPLCYLHLLQGGGAVGDLTEDATAFGCRDWDFACVITGIWPRGEDDTHTATLTVQWVYDVVARLMPLSSGIYGADLGPDPRDVILATKAFGSNGPRLARLKHTLDPHNILSYACPLRRPRSNPKVTILVTGESGVGKDYCADVLVSIIGKQNREHFKARKISISDAIKRQYAAVSGADFGRLLRDRCYKEQHRPALAKFFEQQVEQQPNLLERHFLNVVSNGADVDVLFITGMRDEAPVVSLSHLVSDSKLIDIRITASSEIQKLRRRVVDTVASGHWIQNSNKDGAGSTSTTSGPSTLAYRPSLFFDNTGTGDLAITRFAQQYILPLVSPDLQQLATMVHTVDGFPQPGIEFRHVLGIIQHQRGLTLCISQLKACFSGEWDNVDMLISCEVGGLVFASALAHHVCKPLALIREAGKLPPPTISVNKPSSHISSLASRQSKISTLEMRQGLVSEGTTVVVVDDVFATGRTLCAVLELLTQEGVNIEDIHVTVVAEFPVHRGRQFLSQHGFGGVLVQSLLVFDGP